MFPTTDIGDIGDIGAWDEFYVRRKVSREAHEIDTPSLPRSRRLSGSENDEYRGIPRRLPEEPNSDDIEDIFTRLSSGHDMKFYHQGKEESEEMSHKELFREDPRISSLHSSYVATETTVRLGMRNMTISRDETVSEEAKNARRLKCALQAGRTGPGVPDLNGRKEASFQRKMQPRQRSLSRGARPRKDREGWMANRRRTPSFLPPRKWREERGYSDATSALPARYGS